MSCVNNSLWFFRTKSQYSYIRCTSPFAYKSSFHPLFSYLHLAVPRLAKLSIDSIITTHGTLIGVDDEVQMPKQRSLAALIGLTWRRHLAEMDGRGSPSPDIQHVKTFRLMHRSGKVKQLKGMVVEWEGIVAAVEEVNRDVLLVAQRPLNEFVGETDAIGKRLARLAQEAKPDDREDVSDGTREPDSNVPKARILELRAQGMAEAIAQEWPGPLPDGFY